MSNEPTVYKGPEFDEKSFWDKIASAAGQAGREVLETALALFYCLTDKETPYWASVLIVGALAYFVLPLDAIPDAVVALGYTDDIGVMVGAVRALGQHFQQAHKDRAHEWLDRQLEGPDAP